MKKFRLIGFTLLIFVAQSAIGQNFEKSQKLTDWFFHLGDVPLGGRISLDHSEWDKVNLPHDWSVDQHASPDLSSCTGYLPGGVGWYRTNINIPDPERHYYLYFEGVYNNSEVYINGKWLGKRPNGYVSFYYDITRYVKAGEDNVVAVKVDHSEDADSRWYTGSGIYRPVHLITTNAVHIDPWGVYYKTTQEGNNKALMIVETTVNNKSKETGTVNVRHELTDSNGKVIASSRKRLNTDSQSKNTVKQDLVINNPELWGLENPYLYTLNTIVSVGGKVVDQRKVNAGIRFLTFDPNKGFALNGEWMKIKGVCLHHDAGVLGAAVPPEVWRARILKLKEIGVNGIRMSHNPQASALYGMCDELGMLVMDEAFDEWEYPKKKWIEGWNKGTPGFQGPASYFREWGKKDLASIIYRNRNHPSIIMWSIGNEVDYPNDPYSHPILSKAGIDQQHTSGYLKSQPNADRLGDIAIELAEVVREIDDSRPVTAALAGAVMSNETTYPGALDVVGYNYTESRYALDHEKYPNRILYGSETRHDLNAWKAVRDNDFIFGQFIWTGFDYLGEAGPWPSRGFTTGMIDQANNIKPRGYFRKALWTEVPTVYVGSYPVPRRKSSLSVDAPHVWNYDEGEMVRVVTYTNCDEAELTLNGELIGERKAYDPETAIIHWDVPFQEGELKVTGFRDGKAVAEDVIVTSTVPVKIKPLQANYELVSKGDVALVEVELIDQNGHAANLADNLIVCEVDGPGKLLGLENASHNANEDFNSRRLRAKNGKLLAYIQATEDSGNIEVKFKSTYLEGANVTIQISNGQ